MRSRRQPSRMPEGRLLWGSVVYTLSYGARLSSVPLGDRSVNPATYGASGHRGLQRAHLVASTRDRSGAGRLAASKEVLEQLDRLFLARHPFQGIELATLVHQ
ncbi:hypothetical protein M9458_006129, partial [Cirrhinus mrigala]